MTLSLIPPTDPVLWTAAAPVTDIDAQVIPHLADMAHLMREHNGVGLAAPQVGLSLAFFIWVDSLGDEALLRTFINPTIMDTGRHKIVGDEACLSFPGRSAIVERLHLVELAFQDTTGNWRTEVIRGARAKVVQHEIDHLKGVCIFPHP